MHFFQQWWDVVIKANEYPAFLSFLPKVLLAVIIPILDSVYNEIAVWLNDMGKCAKNMYYAITTEDVFTGAVNNLKSHFPSPRCVQKIINWKSAMRTTLLQRCYWLV